MKNSIPMLFTVTAGFAVAELSASIVHQSPVLADPPVAYYRFGDAPGSTIAVDSSSNAHDGVYRGSSKWRVLKWNAPFTIEAWVQLIGDYQVDSKIFGKAETGTGNGYGLDISRSEARLSGSANFSALTPLNEDLFEARGVLGEVAIHNFALAPAPGESWYQVETVVRTGVLTSLGLALILLGLVPRERRSRLKFRGRDAELSRGRILQVGIVKLRKRSEAELNSFSARYATIEVRAEAPLTGCWLAWRAASRYARH